MPNSETITLCTVDWCVAPLEHFHCRILGIVTWYEANTSSQQDQSGSWKSGLLKRSLNISSCPKPPETQALWLSFILAPVSFKRDQLLELKLMCLCGHSILLKLTEAETDESNQFVNFSKGTALKAEMDQIHTFPAWWRKFNFSFTLKKFCVDSQKLFWTVL